MLWLGMEKIVFTDRGIPTFVELFPSPGCPMVNMEAIAKAGFNVITLAGNHICDRGLPGVEDTIAGFKKLGIAVTGCGLNIERGPNPSNHRARRYALWFFELQLRGSKWDNGQREISSDAHT